MRFFLALKTRVFFSIPRTHSCRNYTWKYYSGYEKYTNLHVCTKYVYCIASYDLSTSRKAYIPSLETGSLLEAVPGDLMGKGTPACTSGFLLETTLTLNINYDRDSRYMRAPNVSLFRLRGFGRADRHSAKKSTPGLAGLSFYLFSFFSSTFNK